MSRKWKVGLAALTLLVSIALPAAAAESSVQSPGATPAHPLIAANVGNYWDVPPEHWAYAPVMKLAAAGVLSVDSSGMFRPDDPVRRSELLKMVLAARRIDVGTECKGVFQDAPCSAWYAPYVEGAYRLAITDGQSADLFAPNALVTRQELFTLMVRAMGRRWEAENVADATVSSRLKQFGDRSEIAGWAQPAVALAVGDELTRGYADGTFRPKATATRAEAAAAVSRILLPAEQAGMVQVDGRQVFFGESLDVTASAYNSDEPGLGNYTATGLRVREGIVAVDPRVIPLGHLLYVEGYGYAIAGDTGGAIKGNRLDLYVDTYHQAIQFGMQKRRVWLLP